ncbi:Uncharacterized protein QTN25_009401 [Entamoeba marina]
MFILNGVISYGDSSTRTGWVLYYPLYYGSFYLSFTFTGNTSSTNMQFVDSDYDGDNVGRYFFLQDSSIVMSSLNYKIFNSNTLIYIDTTNNPDGLTFYGGCFNGENLCRTYLSSDIKTRVDLYSQDTILYGDVDQLYLLNYMNSENQLNPPYVYISGIFTQTVSINITFTFYSSINLYEGYYLLTASNISFSDYYLYDGSLGSPDPVTSYQAASICYRDNTNRYAYYLIDTEYSTNCSCHLTTDSNVITSTTSFTFPDCSYNSSLFDLVLPSSISSFIINDLMKWYSILCSSNSQTITPSGSLQLTTYITEFDSIIFNGYVHIDLLNISKANSVIFDSLDFTDIDYTSISDDDVLFFIEFHINKS